MRGEMKYPSNVNLRPAHVIVDGDDNPTDGLFYSSHNDALRVALKKNGLYIKKTEIPVCQCSPSVMWHPGHKCKFEYA